MHYFYFCFIVFVPGTLLTHHHHDQALYGRTDGLYSRAMLAKGLKNQKSLTDRLEKLLVAQTVEMEECKELIDRLDNITLYYTTLQW